MRISSVIMVLIILLILFGFISHYALNSYSTILELKKTIRDLIQENDGLSLELTKASGRIVVLENTLRNQQNTVIMLQEKEKERNLENLSLTQKLGICQSSQKNSPLLISLMGENNTSPIIFQKRISS
jgi:regulator of replication initiation timing